MRKICKKSVISTLLTVVANGRTMCDKLNVLLTNRLKLMFTKKPVLVLLLFTFYVYSLVYYKYVMTCIFVYVSELLF